MKMLHDFSRQLCEAAGLHRRGGKSGLRLGARVLCVAAVLTFWLGVGDTVHAQVVPSADAGGLAISAGGAASGFYLQYGARKMLGITAFADVDTRRRIGIEAEGRWLEFRQTANVHAETYSIGPRYHRSYGKFQPYVKGLIGFGEFNFPYNLAHSSYLTVTGGGGLDYHLSRRIYLRAADVEYQYWPQFTFGAMSSVGVSAGLRVRVF
jgi:hypothetical protein